MAERTTKIILEIIWDDAICDHPMGWDWNYLVIPAQMVTTKIIDPEGEGWPSEDH